MRKKDNSRGGRQVRRRKGGERDRKIERGGGSRIEREKEKETEMTEHGCRVRRRSRGHDRRHNTSGLVVHSSDATYTHAPLRRSLSISFSLLDRVALCALAFLPLSYAIYIYTRDSLDFYPRIRVRVYTQYIYIYTHVRYTGLRVTTTRLSISPLFSASSLPRLCVKRRGLGGSLLPWTGAKARTENRDRAIY